MSKRKPKPTDTPAIHCQHTRLEPIENLREHPKNPNAHSDTQIALLAKNIRHLGWRHPILVSGLTGFIVAGHARLQAARVLNLAAVPVDVQPFDSETEEMAYLISDNRIAELAEIQNAAIKDLLQELDSGEIDMDLTGYTAEAIERLMTQYHPDEVPDFDPDRQVPGTEGQIRINVVCAEDIADSVQESVEKACARFNGQATVRRYA